MAKGKELGPARRGIAFSTASALVVSVLILIVGQGYHSWEPEDGKKSRQFSITQLGGFIKHFVGEGGVIVFAIGFIAAALSSMLTVPLGAALTADSVFSDEIVPGTGKQSGQDNPNFEYDDQEAGQKQNNKEKSPEELEMGRQETQKLPKFVYFGIIFIMVIISTVVISANGKIERIFELQ